MSLTSKLWTTAIVSTLIAGAAEFNLESFIKHSLVKNPQVKIQKLKVIAEEPLPGHPDWKAYMFTMELSFRGKKQTIPDTLFVNQKEQLVSLDLIDLRTGRDLKETIRPTLSQSYYDAKHLVAGHADAPHKIVVFSDPQCPFCIGYVPGLVKEVKAHPDKLALYYYHMPLLSLHPVSETLTRVMEYLQSQGKTDEAFKLYKLKIDPRTRDEKKILAAIKKQLGIEITPSEIDKPEYKKAVQADIQKAREMMVRGTPTVFFNGKYDANRNAYKKYLK
ncbi:DsbA family protein [Nitratifractor sp.]